MSFRRQTKEEARPIVKPGITQQILMTLRSAAWPRYNTFCLTDFSKNIWYHTEAGASPASVRTTKEAEGDWPRQKVHTEMSMPNTREGS